MTQGTILTLKECRSMTLHSTSTSRLYFFDSTEYKQFRILELYSKSNFDWILKAHKSTSSFLQHKSCDELPSFRLTQNPKSNTVIKSTKYRYPGNSTLGNGAHVFQPLWCTRTSLSSLQCLECCSKTAGKTDEVARTTQTLWKGQRINTTSVLIGWQYCIK